ncbi:MAG: hypothetical protein KGJ37_06775, partial [Verrucomicrobiota bacterium]|nr:hypothetical protein [Verrucomicrobiota bacterium]
MINEGGDPVKFRQQKQDEIASALGENFLSRAQSKNRLSLNKKGNKNEPHKRLSHSENKPVVSLGCRCRQYSCIHYSYPRPRRHSH